MTIVRRTLLVAALALVAACSSQSPMEPVGACESVPTMGSNGRC